MWSTTKTIQMPHYQSESENKQSHTSIATVTNPNSFAVVAAQLQVERHASCWFSSAVCGNDRVRRKEKGERGFERTGEKLNWGFNLWIAQHRFF